MAVETGLAPLTDLRVLDLTGKLVPGMARLLADLGADVIRQARSDETTELADEAHGDSGGLLADEIEALAETSDVVLVDDSSGAARRYAAAGFGRRAAEGPSIWIDVSDFGRTSSRSGWTASAGVHFALSGALARSGLPEYRTPLMPPAFIVDITAAVHGVWLLLLAVVAAARTREDQAIDFAVSDAMFHGLDPAFGIKGTVLGTRDLSAAIGRPDSRDLYPVFHVADGWVRICVLSPGQWRGLFGWLGEPAAFADPRFEHGEVRLAAARELYPEIGRLLADLSQEEAVREGQARGVPIAAIRPASGALPASELCGAEPSDGDTATNPGKAGIFVIDGRRMRFPAPRSRTWRTASRFFDGLNGWDAAALPLEGLRVLDLGVIVAGAETGRLLADYGADVIKIESPDHLDGSRLATLATGMSTSFARGHRNKRSMGVNLRHDLGRRVFSDLIAVSDVMVSNFKPGTLDSLGLDHKALERINPALVTVEGSAFGASPDARRLFGYGPLVRASAGVTHEWQYPGQNGSYGDGLTVFPDHLAGRLAAIAAVSLCLRSRRTGEAGNATIAQLDLIRDASAFASARPNAPDAPCGVFAGPGGSEADTWLYLEVDGDRAFQEMCAAIGRDDITQLDRFASRSQRIAHREELDEIISAWVSGVDPATAASVLQRVGVKAAPVVHEVELTDDVDVSRRALLANSALPGVSGSLIVQGGEALFASGLTPRLNPAPRLAEHTRTVAEELLGLTPTEIDALVHSRALFAAPQAGRQGPLA
ncbi:CoA transferase [Microbacterium lacus]|uniref:CoA transferase n=1 Tax=Microbacterium lacus TaxID=415217 RepID=A0ABN2HGL7_9MICO